MNADIPHFLLQRVDRWRVPLLCVGIAGVVAITVPNFHAATRPWIDMALWGCVAVFALEWSLHVWISVRPKPRWRDYLVSWGHLADALAVVPIVVAFAAGMPPASAWLLGALWLLKPNAARSSLALLLRVAILEAKALTGVVVLFLMVLFFAAVALHVIERDAQPENFGTLPAALYWAISTLTTTGYGDVVPATGLGRLVAGAVMICGLAVFGLWTGILATGFAQESRRADFLQTWDIVARAPFFGGLSPAEIIEIAKMLKRWDVPSQTVVVRQGRQGDCMYFIASGQVEARLDHRVFEYGAGAFFGELALLGEGVRTATVIATAPTTLLILDRSDFRLLVARHPELANAVETEAADRIKRSAGSP
jgi:voltage-gated potassium channel